MSTLLSWLLAAAHAQPTWIPEAQFRPRFEVDSGRDFTADAGNVAFITHRARLGATWASGPVEARLVFQDVRSWGEEGDTRRDFTADGIDLGIGTVTWRPHDDFAMVFGRQEVAIHQERLIARANWRQPGRRFDGLRAGWAHGDWAAEGGAFLVVDTDRFLFSTQDQVEPAPGGNQTLWFARAGLEADGATAQAIAVVDSRRQTPGAEVLRVTPGLFVQGASGALSGHVEAYGQVGSIGGGAQSVRAGMAVVSGRLAPEVGGRPRVGLTYAVLSGDGSPDDEVFTAFDTVYSANHRHYGTQDIALFFRGGASTGQGLHDPHVSLGFQPVDIVDVSLDQHVFAPTAGERWLALEPDLKVKVALHDTLTLTGGASLWAELQDPRRPIESFGYVMLDAVLRGPRQPILFTKP